LVPKAFIQAAIIARDELHHKQKSDSIFKLVIASYPATEYAKIAQFESGMAVTITTRQDSAAELYRKAERLFYIDNDVKESIQQFFEVFKIYPDQSIAPKSLFAAAWFSSTVLLKNRTAKMLYEKICEKYPESIYCTQQARPRIKAVVDTLAKLDQLRRENEKKNQGKTKSGAISPKTVAADSVNNDLNGAIGEDSIETDLSITDEKKDTTGQNNTLPINPPVPQNEKRPEINPDRKSPDAQ
jgi:hypothetical protein